MAKAELSTLTQEEGQKIVQEKLKWSNSDKNKRPIATTLSGADETNYEISQKRMKILLKDDSSEPWLDANLFDSEWLTFLKTKLPNIAPVNQIGTLEFKKWFVLHPNHENPMESTFTCRPCTQAGPFMYASQYKSKYANAGKMFKNDRHKNSDELREHMKSPGHLASLDYLKSRAGNKGVLDQQFKKAEERANARECEALAVTSKMMKLVYTEVMINVPLYRHRTLVSVVKDMGLNLGYHHYERMSATRMKELISNVMGNDLLKQVKETNGPWAVITDGSTDASSRHYLVVLLQGIENNIPRVYFYRCIHLGEDESAEGLTKALTDAFEEDNIAEKMKKNLVAFTSDGASVMLGQAFLDSLKKLKV